MILTRSPFYYNVVFSNDFVTSVDFTVNVGRGSLAGIIPLQTYELSKLKPSKTSTNTWLDASPFIRDLYDHSPIDTSSHASPTCVTNNEVLLASVTSQETDSLGSTLSPGSLKYVCTDGYGYFGEGQNYEPSKKILLSHGNYKAYNSGHFIVPLRCGSSSPDPVVDGVTVPLNYVEHLSHYVKYLVVPLAGYSEGIEISFDGESIYIELIDECKYPVSEIQFINRYGVLELVHFYKATQESISVKSETFKNAYTNGVSYDVSRHQIKEFNKTSNTKVKIETGFLNPDYNATIKELMQSENVWIGGRPINVSTESLDFKTRIVDKLISYSLNFEYAFDEINNV